MAIIKFKVSAAVSHGYDPGTYYGVKYDRHNRQEVEEIVGRSSDHSSGDIYSAGEELILDGDPIEVGEWFVVSIQGGPLLYPDDFSISRTFKVIDKGEDKSEPPISYIFGE